MAIAFVTAVSGSGGSATTDAVSGNITPSNDNVLLVHYYTRIAQTNDGDVTISGGGLTWTAVEQGAGATKHQWTWRAVVSGSPGTFAVTVTRTSTGADHIVEVLEFSGVDTTTPIGVTATAGNGGNTLSLSVTITTLTDNSWVISCWGATLLKETKPTGFTSRVSVDTGGFSGTRNGAEVATKATTTAGNNDHTWGSGTDTFTAFNAITAIELHEAAAAGGGATGFRNLPLLGVG